MDSFFCCTLVVAAVAAAGRPGGGQEFFLSSRTRIHWTPTLVSVKITFHKRDQFVCREAFSFPNLGLGRLAAQMLPSLAGLFTALAVRSTTTVFAFGRDAPPGKSRAAALAEGVPGWALAAALTLLFTMINLKPLTLRGKWHVAKWTA